MEQKITRHSETERQAKEAKMKERIGEGEEDKCLAQNEGTPGRTSNSGRMWEVKDNGNTGNMRSTGLFGEISERREEARSRRE